MNYEEYARIAKALSDPKRVKILDLISCDDLCACDILEHFDFTQPTLSYHIKILVEADLVISTEKGTWKYYSINQKKAEQYISSSAHFLTHTNECVCKELSEKEKVSITI